MENKVDKKDNLSGLGGWLVVVCLGLLWAVFQCIDFAYSDLNSISSNALSAYPSFINGLWFEGLTDAVLGAFVVYLIYLFFKKSKSFPNFYVGYLIFAAFFAMVDYAVISSIISTYGLQNPLQSTISDAQTTIAQTVIAAVIWISYMKKSVRVKNTFTFSKFPQEAVYCAKCGAPQEKTAKFCEKCGAALVVNT